MTKIIGAPTLDDALAALRAQTEANEARGEKTLIFCEDRLTLLAERAVLAHLGGTLLTEVTTFARYLSGPRVLSKQGSVMEIAALIRAHEKELVFFRERAAQAVYETIAQLSASRVDAMMLRASAEETEGTLKGKLLDLALLLECYTARLKELKLLDESGYLSLLPEKLSSGGLLGVNVIFFGFQSFTRQALEGVRAAIGHAAQVTGIFLAGRTGFYTNTAARAFRRVAEECAPARSSMVKSSLEGDALALSEGLFSPERFSEPPRPVQTIRRFSAEDEAREFEKVAALIKKHVAEGARFRDIAVLIADEESLLPLEKAFSAYRIPFFADRKRAFSEHPFCAFALSVLLAVSDGVLPDEADAIAANVYFGRGDNYRNYLLRYGGYRGAVRREIKEGDAVKGYFREELVACRERMLSSLALFPRKGKGRAYTEGVRALYALVGGERVTEELKGYFTGAEAEFLDPAPLEGVLAEIEALAGERTFTAREFYDTFKSGLEALAIAMIPQSADAVFVGDATESRFERVPILFATGLTDALPRTAQDTAVITDGEMGRLAALKVEIEPAIAEVNARARETLALNLCSFTEALYLSAPLRRGNEDAERGEVLQYAEALFEMPPMPEFFPYDCCEELPAALKLLSLKEGYERGRENDTEEFSALYALLNGEGEADGLLGGGGKPSVPAAGELYFSGAVSPTLLEGYFECPYRGFAARALKLREREERPVLDTETGTFVHTVLEQCAVHFNELSGEEECRALARGIGSSLISSRFAALSDTAAGVYTGQRLVEEAAEVTVVAFTQLRGSAFRVEKTEAPVGIPELLLSGKTDRIDSSDGFVRVIDYKTGTIDDTLGAYYTGRKLQLELYLRAAAEGRTPAGAFYFPAAESFTKEGEVKYRMSGFYCADDEVVSRMDRSLAAGEKSEFFDGKLGSCSEKGMKLQDFKDFLDYGVLVSARAENEMRRGNIAPSPYTGACTYCKFKSLCGFVGEPRKERGIGSAEIAEIVRREKGEKE